MIGESVGSRTKYLLLSVDSIASNFSRWFVSGYANHSEEERLHELQDSLMLFFTGLSRNAPDIAQSKIENFNNRETELTHEGNGSRPLRYCRATGH